MRPIATFSIVAFDPGQEEWGIAVQSKFMAVGAVVPGARAGVGAVATQSFANMAYVPEGLALMEGGMSAQQALKMLTAADENAALRQAGMIDKNGQAAAYTGEGCNEWAGHIVGEGFTCQGNILIPGTVEAMAQRFEQARIGRGELADWLVDALEAGQAAGGDSRGRQSAAVLVVRQGGGYGGNNDRYLDLRVDDHPYPIRELKRLVSMHHLYFGEIDTDTLIPLAKVAQELQEILHKSGHLIGENTGIFDDAARGALRSLIGIENLEERWTGDKDTIDQQTLDFLRQRFK